MAIVFGEEREMRTKPRVMEARLKGCPPFAVTQHAENLHQAVDGASDNVVRLIEGTLGRAPGAINSGPAPSVAED